jgi:hypothetical protein
MTVVPIKPNATGTSEEHPESAPYARSAHTGTGAHAVGEADATPKAAPDALDEADPDDSDVDGGPGLLDRTVAFWTPPEIWSQPRPSLAQVAAYAWRGSWTGEDTASRQLGRVYAALVSIPAHAVGYVLLWLIERPARFAVTALLAFLIFLSVIV